MIRLLVFTLLGASFALHAQSPGDDTAIRALVQSYFDAREHRDPGRLAGLFTANADQLVSSGEWRKGRQALVDGVLASSARESGKRTIEIETIRHLTADVAIADGRYTITGAAGPAGPRNMWSAFILQKQNGRWFIAAIRNMLPAARP
jgi:uncharacterized protein (TIGR02246 family)